MVKDNNELVARHQEVCNLLHDIYEKKNHDYGNSFSKSFAKRGIVGAMTRLEDKWNRLDNLTLNHDVKVTDEAIGDTLLDMANYCIMLYMELENL